MAKKKIAQHLYVKENIRLIDHELRWIELDNGCLFSNSASGYRKTTITKEDLPESFIPGRYYKRWGYLDTSHIEYITYKPSMYCFYDYFSLKDDEIIIGYTDDYEYSVCGNEIVDVLKGAEKYSNYNISEIKDQIWHHIENFNKSNNKHKKILTKEEFEKWWD